MKISEIFYSIQGEGKLIGVPSVFIRTSGCNLRCTWCDTPYASWTPEGEDLSLDALVAKTLEYGARHVVITGGEPMMFKETVALVRRLKEAHQHITMETAGTLWLSEMPPHAIDLASISPKLSNSTPSTREGGRFAQSHERQRLNLDVLRAFAGGGGSHNVVVDRQWKFVVSQESDLTEIDTLVHSINEGLPAEHRILPTDIMLMPEGTDGATLSERSLWLAEICKRTGYRMTTRLHVYLWGNKKGV